MQVIAHIERPNGKFELGKFSFEWDHTIWYRAESIRYAYMKYSSVMLIENCILDIPGTYSKKYFKIYIYIEVKGSHMKTIKILYEIVWTYFFKITSM